MLDKKIEIQVGGSGRTFYPIPADKYTVQISDVNSVVAKSPYTGEDEVLLNFEFTVLDNKNFDYLNDDKEQEIESTRGRRLWKRMRPVIADGNKGKASWFYKLLVAIERKAETADYFSSIDPNGLIGQQVMVMVNKTPGKDKKEYNNILDFAPVEKELNPVDVSAKEDLNPVDVSAKEDLTDEDTSDLDKTLKGENN